MPVGFHQLALRHLHRDPGGATDGVKGVVCDCRRTDTSRLGGGREGRGQAGVWRRVWGTASAGWHGLPEPTQAHSIGSDSGTSRSLLPLPDNAKQAVVAVDGTDLKGCRFADPQTAGVHDGKAGSVDRVGYAAKQPADFCISEGVGQVLLAKRTLLSRRICLGVDREHVGGSGTPVNTLWSEQDAICASPKNLRKRGEFSPRAEQQPARGPPCGPRRETLVWRHRNRRS